jgi:ElaB/YqjD/DUF883 family membrane-anchored ribosome-binding protein
MTNRPASFRDSLANEASMVGEKLSDTAADVKDTVANLGRVATRTIDENRGAAASGLERAASAMHHQADSLPGGEEVSGLGHAAADKLSSTADYVRKHKVDRMVADVGTLIKNNPGRSLLAAAVVGFLVARAFRGND